MLFVLIHCTPGILIILILNFVELIICHDKGTFLYVHTWVLYNVRFVRLACYSFDKVTVYPIALLYLHVAHKL